MGSSLELYARLLIRQGVNLCKGDTLAIKAGVDSADLVRAVTLEAYIAGAKKVTVFWNDAVITKYAYRYQSERELERVDDWVIASRRQLVEERACYLAIMSERDGYFDDIDPIKLRRSITASGKALAFFSEAMGQSKLRWALGAYPNPSWAKRVFPTLNEAAAEAKLWEYIYKALRLDTPDPLKAWTEHSARLERRIKRLNDARIVRLYYKNNSGTDFSVELPKGYKFVSTIHRDGDGRPFTANLPSEEVFCSPDFRTAQGRLNASMPLVTHGGTVKDFYFEFTDGVVTDFGAREGYEILKAILGTDEGSRRLGELALVGYDSPISNLNTLFYNTLFDENASCHFALGRGFSWCVKGGADMSKERMLAAGINTSLQHTDFMVGTRELSVIAVLEDSSCMIIFENGDWAF
jgi:aminopeptidase